jgi:histidinol dehydrogenase
MIKKMFSVSELMAKTIEDLAKQQNTTQSRIIETSLMMYVLFNTASPEATKKINKLVSEHQEIIYNDLEKIIKKGLI